MEFAAEPLVGFRAWKIDGRTLRSVWQTTETWAEPGSVKAECFVRRGCMMYVPPPTGSPSAHPSPDGACTCGIYAYYRMEEARTEKAHCWGAIIAWGRIVECERGFKAQCARSIALLEPDPDSMPESVATIAERYELPVLPLAELEQYAHMFGEVRVTPA